MERFHVSCVCAAAHRSRREPPRAWSYESTVITGVDATSFRVLSAHYARDRQRVYYGETFRDSRDYFTTKRSRVFVVEHADPGTFAYLKDGYAKDRASGYYHQVAVPGSDGSTFSALDLHYSRDNARVFYSELVPGTSPVRRIVQLKGARVDSFAPLDAEGYASDSGQVYFRGKILTRADAASFKVLAFGYAKTTAQVYYRGEIVAGADAATFETLERPTDTADARDRHRSYQLGRKGPA